MINYNIKLIDNFCEKLKIKLTDSYDVLKSIRLENALSYSNLKDIVDDIKDIKINNLPTQEDIEKIENNKKAITKYIDAIEKFKSEGLMFSDIANIKIQGINSNKGIIQNVHKLGEQNKLINHSIDNLIPYMKKLSNDAKKRDFPALFKTFEDLKSIYNTTEDIEKQLVKLEATDSQVKVSTYYQSIREFQDINKFIKQDIFSNLLKYRTVIAHAIEDLKNITKFIIASNESHKFSQNDIEQIVHDIKVFEYYIINIITYLNSCKELINVITKQVLTIYEWVEDYKRLNKE